MTTGKASSKRKTGEKEMPEITFQCKFCGDYKDLKQIKTLTRFFPPLVICKDCEKRLW